MPFTREQAFDALSRWQPAPVFLDAYRLKRLPENLDIFFGAPEEFFLAPETQALYTQERFIPILDNGNFNLVLFDDPDANHLIEVAIEDPKDATRFLNWQQFLAHLLLNIGESFDDNDRIRRIATLIQFRYVDDLFTLWEQVGELPYDEYRSGCQSFVARLDG
jgi:hypothetical protein